MNIFRAFGRKANPKDIKEDNVEPLEAPLEFVVGKDASGRVVLANLAIMPHLLIGGQTGSGKSTMLNNIIVSLLLKNTPETLRLILVDPKIVELRLYDDVPHLERPALTEPTEWMDALCWLEKEASRRRRLFTDNKVKDIDEYNKQAVEALPHIVVVSDEFSDMMMFDAEDKEIERIVAAITPYAQVAGVHLIISTSRTSTSIYTDVIKEHFSTRLAFATNSAVDSETILDEAGAEQLLGRGDALFKRSSDSKPLRLQAPHVSRDEIIKILEKNKYVHHL